MKRLWRRRPGPVRVDLTETPESRARKAAEADWDRIHAHIREQRQLREANHFGPRMAAAFEGHREDR